MAEPAPMADAPRLSGRCGKAVKRAARVPPVRSAFRTAALASPQTSACAPGTRLHYAGVAAAQVRPRRACATPGARKQRRKQHQRRGKVVQRALAGPLHSRGTAGSLDTRREGKGRADAFTRRAAAAAAPTPAAAGSNRRREEPFLSEATGLADRPTCFLCGGDRKLPCARAP
eukprot:352821-Chlamydomonas_euryale.AAC.10